MFSFVFVRLGGDKWAKRYVIVQRRGIGHYSGVDVVPTRAGKS